MARADKTKGLSARERQLMDALYSLGRGTAAEIRDALPDPPSYTTIRTLLGILEKKGHLSHFEDGPRYVYEPTVSRQEMAKSSLQSVIKTFFGGSIENAVMTLIQPENTQLSDASLERLQSVIEEARKEGR